MAARVQPPVSDSVGLSQISVAELDPLLAEEISLWRERYKWDFRPSADLLRRFLQIRSLNGRALVIDGHVAGYGYYVWEGRKGLIGNFFVSPAYSTPDREMRLLRDIIEDMRNENGVRRIESQLMMLRATTGPFPFPVNLLHQERAFMEADAESLRSLQSTEPTFRVQFQPYQASYDEQMSHLLAACYRGHVDSEINDQYRSIPGTRQFLTNIIRFPGCGRFAPESSMLAFDGNSGRACGMCLASRVSDVAGHITQLCVLPALRQSRLGYELMRQTSLRLVETGSTAVSLTVTCANTGAVRLYSSAGFRTVARFPALVWDRL